MPMKDPTQSAQKWASNLSKSVESIRNGVNAVTVSPTVKAAAELEKAKNNYVDAIDSGRTAAALNAVSVNDWKQAMLNKGVPRIQSGAAAGQANYVKFAQKFYPIMDQAAAAARAIPNNSTADALERVRIVMEAAKNFAGKRS